MRAMGARGMGTGLGRHCGEASTRRQAHAGAGVSTTGRGSVKRGTERAGRRRASEIYPCCSIPHDRLSDFNGKPGTLDDFLERLQREKRGSSDENGPHSVHLVGTGPGDPELLTLKAVRLMQQADVVLYDRLISSEILEFVNEDALMIYVGKEKGFHTRTQPEIHELLLQFCQSGALVVRLKGGDPYVFGRGGEELDYLQQQGVDVQCVPGITAAAGISSTLGIPLTHRGVADSVQFITGHLRKPASASPGQAFDEETLDELRVLAGKVSRDVSTTLVVYMGLSTLSPLSLELLSHGADPTTPSVAVERGTMADQRAVFAHLGDLSDMVERAELKSPTLILIGHVVALAPGWKEQTNQQKVVQTASV